MWTVIAHNYTTRRMRILRIARHNTLVTRLVNVSLLEQDHHEFRCDMRYTE